ncbi:acyl-CoA dehydrogenase family protein [Brevundimonas sp.]|uniref:acyl-CoA dehydrogenase family protein n=1 Tax=Brevundimonas sp. TaxID=1871086 RepID=UPI0026190251|nr:acyl-CoA dehydrogenase family protein [Brevundimonas sp.]
MNLFDQFGPPVLPSGLEPLRARVRAFLAEWSPTCPPEKRALSWMGFDADFSRSLGAKGWLGLSMPKQYGGQDASPFERFVVSEELLAAGAPVTAHWIADRQSAPLILRHGTEAQKQRYLPPICAGEMYFCIGMSEPASGSDLASVRTKADRQPDGSWLLNGRKVWTTNADRCHAMIALVRTDPASERHAGLSQIIVDLTLPGVIVRPIKDLSGHEHFNEVTFDNVRLDADALIGVEGEGWTQATSELAFERSGPERFLSAMTLFSCLVGAIGPTPDARQAMEIGRLAAWLISLRSMSVSLTAQLAAGQDPVWGASCVKDLGTGYEQDTVEVAMRLIDSLPPGEQTTTTRKVLAITQSMAPSFSLRGGTREILRGILARGLGVR